MRSALFGLLLIVVGAHSINETTTVTSVAGGTARLPCAVPFPLSPAVASHVLWYRAGRPDPVYTLDVRRGRHFTPLPGGRVRFEPPLLHISPVAPEDAGDYRCRVDMRRTRTLILHARLVVIVPPDEPIIMDEYGERLQGVVGPYNEGASVTFVCDVDGGDPSPSVAWLRDGGPVAGGDVTTTRGGFVRNTLRLAALRRGDLGAEYLCRAANTNLTKPMTAAITLDLNLLPLDVRIVSPNRPLLSGERYDILCRTSGSKPPAVTSWWLNGQKVTSLTKETVEETENVTSNVLTFVPHPEHHGKLLTCKSANPAIAKSTVEASIILDIHFAPIVSLGSGRLEAIEGDLLLLNCSVRANPAPFRTQWLLSAAVAVTNQSIGLFVDGSTLVLKEARRQHSGDYRCAAENSVDRTVSDRLRLIVRYRPKCKYPDLQTFVLTDTDETFNVTCDTEADPDEVAYRWTSGTKIVRDWSDSNSVYTHDHPGGGSEETLSCWGRNSAGIQMKPCRFKLITARAPDSPAECQVVNFTLHSFSVKCQPGYNGSLRQGYHLEVYSSSNLIRNLSEANLPAFRVQGLSSGTPYTLKIYSSNMKGRSLIVTIVTATPSLTDAAAQENSTVSTLIFGLITMAVVFFCFAFLSFGIFFYTYKIRKTSHTGSTKDNINTLKTELPDTHESNGKGPDIIPQSAESEVFFLSGKIAEEPILSVLDNSPSAFRKYKHTVL